MIPYARRPFLLASMWLAFASSPAWAKDDFQQWTSLSAKVETSGDVVILNELTARFSDQRGGLYEIENALQIGYNLTEKLTISAGYVHNPNYSAGDFSAMERRVRTQVTLEDFASLGVATLSARMRLEQRWRDNIPGTGWRARPHIKVAIPLGSRNGPSVILTAEPFINFNRTAFQPQDGLERLRSAISLSFPVSETLRIDTGYLNQHRFVRGGRDNGDHALTLAVGYSF